MLRKITLLILLLSGAVTAGAQSIVFTPQWTPQAQFAGYYAAMANGFYRDAGLDVRIVHPSASNSCWNSLKSGNSQIITLQLAAAIHLIDEEKIPVVNILQTSQQNCLVVVSRKPLEKGVESLREAKVGRWNAGFAELVDLLNIENGLNIQWVPFLQNINLFISGAIDATMAMTYNEYQQLLLSGLTFQDNQLVYFSKIGYNVPEDGIYVTKEWYEQHKDEADRFAQASRKGWEWCAEHPDEALEIVMKQCQDAYIRTNRTLQRRMLKEILESQKDIETGERHFQLKSEHVALASKLLYEAGYISREYTHQQISAR